MTQRPYPSNVIHNLLRFVLILVGVILLAEVIIAKAFGGGHKPASADDWRRTMIPVRAIAENPRLVIYGHREMPRAYQLQSSFHWVGYNISGDPPDVGLPNGQGGNAGVDFPWRVTGGTDACKNIETFTWLLLPENKPIVWWSEPLFDGIETRTGYRWLFPVGTQFGEVLMMEVAGHKITCEMRIRERVHNDWAVDILRPFPEATDLALAIKRHRTDWESDQQLADAVRHLEADIDLQAKILTDTKHPVRAIKLQASEDYLPPIPGELVHELMTKTPFRSALGKTWRGTDCYAPANVVMPDGYRGTFIGNDGGSCATCHRTTLVPARTFDGPRGWYGNVPGSDEVFSWYPTLPQAISRNGDYVTPRIPSIPGFLERYNPGKHSRETYQVIKRGSGDRPPRPTPYRGYGY